MEDAATNGAPWIPVSWGELFDKISILEIKAARISDAARRANVERELSMLRGIRGRTVTALPEGVDALSADLSTVNNSLWDIEDQIRQLDRQGDFGPRFVELARDVYRTNAKRSALKRQIDELTKSPLVEEKWYQAEPVHTSR